MPKLSFNSQLQWAPQVLHHQHSFHKKTGESIAAGFSQPPRIGRQVHWRLWGITSASCQVLVYLVFRLNKAIKPVGTAQYRLARAV